MKEYSEFPKAPVITGASQSDCLVSYPEHSLAGVLLLCREAVGVFYSPSRLGNQKLENSAKLTMRHQLKKKDFLTNFNSKTSNLYGLPKIHLPSRLGL